MIEVQELYKYYGEKRALGPVEASIARGEVVGHHAPPQSRRWPRARASAPIRFGHAPNGGTIACAPFPVKGEPPCHTPSMRRLAGEVL